MLPWPPEDEVEVGPDCPRMFDQTYSNSSTSNECWCAGVGTTLESAFELLFCFG